MNGVDTTYDYTKPELSLMFDVLRHSNSKFPIEPSEISWGPPIAVFPQDHGGRDTSIVASITNSDRYRGKGTYYYRRVPLRRLLQQCGNPPRILIGMRPTLYENLTFINAALSANLEQVSVDDIDLNSLSVNADEWTLVYLSAKATSRVYSGTARLYLKRDNSLV